MKKSMVCSLIASVTAVSLMFTFVGCSSNQKSTSDKPAEGAADSQNDSDYSAQLKLGHIMPIDHPNGMGAEKFAELVEEKTNGNVTVSVFPTSQLGNEKELFDAVDLGSLDFAILGYGEPAKKFNDIGILDAPFLANDREHLVRILSSETIQSIFDEMPSHMNAKALSGFYYGARYLTTSKKEIRDPESLAGMNIRVPDQKLYIDTLSKMGASATPMSFGEVFLALQQGAIDGQENPLATIAANKFDQVQNYLIKTEHIMGANALYVSTKTLEKMPKEYVAAIQEAAKETADWINEKAFETEDNYKKQLVDNGMTLIEDVNKEAFKEATKSIYDDFDQELVAKIRDIK